MPESAEIQMRWTYYQLTPDDTKAKEHVLENLQMGSYEHTLSKKLLQRFSEADGEMLLIAFESFDLDADCRYRHATYCGGQIKPPNLESISWMDCPRWGLIPFIDKHLLKSHESVVLCENVFDTRKDIAKLSIESRLLVFNDEVYHILTSENACRPESIECTIGDAEHQWMTGVCSSCADVPRGDISSEIFFDTIVTNAIHIFTPALDGEGYLIWSPHACLSPFYK